jgi:hypothetical protein
MTAPHDFVEQFDRRFRLVTQTSGRQFIAELRAWMDWFRTDPRFSLVRASIKLEAKRLTEDYRLLAKATADVVEPLRKRLEVLFPEAADTDADRASGHFSSRTFEIFDAHVMKIRSNDGVGFPFVWTEDSTLGNVLFHVLDDKVAQCLISVRNNNAWVHRPDGHQDARDEPGSALSDEVRAAKRRHVYEQQELALRLAASVTGVCIALENALGPGLNPSLTQTGPSELGAAMFLHGRAFDVHKRKDIDDSVLTLRPLAERFHEAIRQQLNARAGLEALADRFRLRCQYYELKELRKLAGASVREKELKLTARFAQYLFDAGYFPFSELNLANNRADLVELGASVYVEAKQVGTSRPKYIVDGYWQLLRGVEKLPREHRVRTGFLLVFVLGGPSYEEVDIPHPSGLVTYLRAVDLREVAEQKRHPTKVRIPDAAFQAQPPSKRKKKGPRPSGAAAQ